MENSSIETNLKLSVKVLLKTLDAASPSPDRIELSVLTRTDDGKVIHRMLSDAEVQFLIDEIQKEIEVERKQSEAASGDM